MDTFDVVMIGAGPVAEAATHVLGEGIPEPASSSSISTAQLLVAATFTGPDTQELSHSGTIAIAGAAAVPLDRLWHAVPPFPTISEVRPRLLEAYGM